MDTKKMNPFILSNDHWRNHFRMDDRGKERF